MICKNKINVQPIHAFAFVMVHYVPQIIFI
jgi:hypothetical protein